MSDESSSIPVREVSSPTAGKFMIAEVNWVVTWLVPSGNCSAVD